MDAYPHRHSSVVLDRHPLWLSELGNVLEHAGFEVVATTTSEARALQLLRQHQPDMFIFEPEACTSATTRVLEAARLAAPTVKAVAVSATDDPDAVAEALRSGASAYVLKHAHPEDIAVAVRQAFSHSIHFAHRFEPSGAPRPPATSGNGAGLSLLTRREREIMALVAEGHSNATMARKLWVTEQTVKFHLSNIYRKLGLPNRTAATRWAHEHGIVSSSPTTG